MKHLLFSTVMAVLFLPLSIMGQDLQQNTLKNKQQEEIETIRQRAIEIRDSLNQVYSDISKGFQNNPLKSLSATSKVLDSLINNKHNYFTQTFEPESKTTFKFDENDRLLERFEYKILDTQWIEDEKLEVVYDNNGNNLSSTTYRFDETTGQIAGGTKIENIYDSANNLKQKIIAQWDAVAGQWLNVEKLERTFDNASNLTQKITANGDTNTGQWVNDTKLEQTYDGNGNLVLKAYFWWRTDTQEWLPSEETSYNAQADILNKIDYSWNQDTGEFYKVQKSEYIYNSGNVLTTVYGYESETYPVTTWTPTFTSNYTYNSNGLLIRIQSAGGKTEYTYYSDGNVESVKYYYWNNYNNTFEPWDGYRYSYDSQGRTTYRSHRFYDFIDGSVNYESVWQYAYDDNGNTTLSSFSEGPPSYLNLWWRYEYTYDQYNNLIQMIDTDADYNSTKYDYTFNYDYEPSQIIHPYEGYLRVEDNKYSRGSWSSDWGNSEDQTVYYYSEPNSNCPIGDITFNAQYQIYSFASYYPECTEIFGNVTIDGPIFDLGGLKNITTIEGSLQIKSTNLTSLTGLENLNSVGDLMIYNNINLTNIDSLQNLNSIDNTLLITSNKNLTSLSSLENISSLSGDLTVGFNDSISSLTGLENLNSIGGNLEIAFSDALESLIGLENLSSVGGELRIKSNDNLTSLVGLENLNSVTDELLIQFNPNLTSLMGLEGLSHLQGNLWIWGNDTLTSLTNLENLTSIGGDTDIRENSSLYSLAGLENLDSIGGYFSISRNDALTSLSGLENLNLVEDLFQIAGNDNLTSLEELENLNSVGSIEILNNNNLTSLIGLKNLDSVGSFQISGNDALTSLTNLESLNSLKFLFITDNDSLTSLAGLENLNSIEFDLFIKDNNGLTSLMGLENLSSVGRDIDVINNPNLATVLGLKNIANIGGDLNLESNTNLSLCNVQSICDYLQNGGTATIGNNAPGCNSQAEVEAACTPVVVCPDNFGASTQQEIDDFPANYPNCTELPGSLYLFGSTFTNLDSLQQITSIGGSIDIFDTNLTNLSGLQNLTSVGGYIDIVINYSLNDISALENIDYTTITGLTIIDNPNLSVCNLPNICEYLSNGGSASISANAQGCDSEEQVQAICNAPCSGSEPSTDSLTYIFDKDLFIDGIGFVNNPSITFTDPGTPANAVLSDISLELYFRLNGTSCENEIAIQITDPTGNTQPLTAYTTCDGGTGLYYVNLDVPNGSTTGSAADWIVEFDDTNDQNTDYEYSVRFARLNYVATTGGVSVVNEVSEYADMDLFIDGVGFENNGTYTFADPGTPSDAVLSDISLELYFRLNGSSCENEIALQITDPAGNTQPLTAYTTCDGGTGLYYVNLDVTSGSTTGSPADWTVQFDDTNDQNSDYEYSVRFGRLTYKATTTGSGGFIIENDVSDIADNDLFIDGVGFDNNDTYTFTDPATPTVATLSDISLELYFRLTGSTCENEIALQITDPAGNTQALTAYATCDGGTGLYYVNLDVPSGSTTGSIADWTVQFDDTNDQNSDYEYSVRFGRLTYKTAYNVCDEMMMIAEENTSIPQHINTTKRNNHNTTTSQHYNTIKLYPVPATQHLNVNYKVEFTSTVQFEIISNSGRTLMVKEEFMQVGQNTVQFDIAELPAGHYYIRTYSADNVPQMQPFIKIAP